MNSELKLLNTLSREKEVFKPIEPGKAKIYTCGPTVYNFAHIGNLRSYIFPDILKKVLKFIGFEVQHIINITDVGHLTSDADAGDDKIEKAAAETGRNAWDISKYYAEKYMEDLKALNIEYPVKFTYATGYIQEQIDLIKKLEERGLTYKTEDGIYFDTAKFPGYGKMAKLDIEGLNEGSRVDAKDKRNKTDFALWKFSPENQQRQMEWESPWGKGFPGWHVECSAMSIAELGEQLDIHTGGTDHIPVHHTNEIAQSEGATDKKFVNYWLHGEFLVLDEKRMGKSEGNFIGLRELVEQGFSAMAYRYLTLTAHYRSFLNFSPDALKAAQTAYFNLKRALKSAAEKNDEKNEALAHEFSEKILNALLDDLNTPKAIGFIWELMGSNETGAKNKLAVVKKFDKVLSLNLLDFSDLPEVSVVIPDEVHELAKQRLECRKQKNWAESDRLRDEIGKMGFEVKDSKEGYEIVPKI